MPIDFHTQGNRHMYRDRHADASWKDFIGTLVEIQGKEVADIACGGGIYCIAFAEMGARHVTGIDFSREMLHAAQEYCQDYPQISFHRGSALASELSAQSFDVILERALTHHLQTSELSTCFTEAARLLKPGGTLLIQNRTPDDCRQAGHTENPRGYFFECFPRLLDIEIGRRQDSATIQSALQQAGLVEIQEHHLLERKERYADFTALAEDISTRKGRSILHELSDEELEQLVAYMRERYSKHTGQIDDTCWWTIWSARKA